MARVAVIGTGSIGGYVAAHLAEVGHELILCARHPFDRLVVEFTDDRDPLIIDQAAVLDPSTVQPAEWVMLATKAHQTIGATDWLSALCGDDTHAVIVLQNGIEGPDAVRQIVPDVPVVPTVVWCGAEQVRPGLLRHHGASSLVVPDDPLGAEVRTLFERSGITIELVSDFTTAAWRKLILNAVASPLTSLTGRRLEVFGDDRVAALAEAVAGECVAVAVADGATLPADEPRRVVDGLRDQPGHMGSSMLYDRQAGRPTEHEALSGAVVRAGRRHGVPTPLNEAMLALLTAAASLPG